MQRRERQTRATNLKERAIGAAVCDCRNQAGVSQEELAAQCGFDRTYISRVERGVLNPTAVRLWKIADVLDIPFHSMVRRMEIWIDEHSKSSKRETPPDRKSGGG
jgi:transcriptional regulator with XRE-family HTH domain